METVARQKQEKITDMKKRMRDIYLAVSWREISRTYFDKSPAFVIVSPKILHQRVWRFSDALPST